MTYTWLCLTCLTTINIESQNGQWRLWWVSINCWKWVSPMILPVWLPGPASWLQTYPSWSAAARRGRWTRPRCCRKVSSNCNIKTQHSILNFWNWIFNIGNYTLDFYYSVFKLWKISKCNPQYQTSIIWILSDNYFSSMLITIYNHSLKYLSTDDI